MMTNDAAAYQLFETPEGVRGRYVRVPLSELGEGDALVRVTHSSVNYKDGLAATGRAPIARSLPMVGGCCAVGVVVEPGPLDDEIHRLGPSKHANVKNEPEALTRPGCGRH